MSNLYLNDSAFDGNLYATNFGPTLAAYTPPVCPATFEGATQVYNADTGMCLAVPPAVAKAPGSTAPQCGGSPFMVEVDGSCMSTNKCPTSANLSDRCLNAQHVPVQPTPLAGPGVLANSVYGGQGMWRWV